MTTEVTLKLDDPAREVRELREAGFHELADEIEAQLPKPPDALQEPVPFGTVIRARLTGRDVPTLWVRAIGMAWYSEGGTYVAGAATLFGDVEVVRVGVGPTPEQVEELVQEFAPRIATGPSGDVRGLLGEFAGRLLGRGGA